MKKKTVSAFEFAIMSVADSEMAKGYKPITRQDELKERKSAIIDKAKRMRIINKPVG